VAIAGSTGIVDVAGSLGRSWSDELLCLTANEGGDPMASAVAFRCQRRWGSAAGPCWQRHLFRTL